jgi:hypothetical protein
MLAHAQKLPDFRDDDQRMHQQRETSPKRPSHRARIRTIATKPLSKN